MRKSSCSDQVAVAAEVDCERWALPEVGPALASGDRLPCGPLTAAQVESLQRRAHDEAAEQGYQSGFARGYDEGLARANGEIQSRIDTLSEIMSHLEAPLAGLDAVVEEALLKLAMAVARQLVRRELKTDPRQVMAAVREALGTLAPTPTSARVYLHPDDAALVREATRDGALWQIIEDPLMTCGGCRVECQHSRIDATVENRLARVIAEVLGGERQADSAGDGPPPGATR